MSVSKDGLSVGAHSFRFAVGDVVLSQGMLTFQVEKHQGDYYVMYCPDPEAGAGGSTRILGASFIDKNYELADDKIIEKLRPDLKKIGRFAEPAPAPVEKTTKGFLRTVHVNVRLSLDPKKGVESHTTKNPDEVYGAEELEKAAKTLLDMAMKLENL